MENLQCTLKPLTIVSDGTMKNKQMWEVIYMGNMPGPEKVNDTCMKTMDRGFTMLIKNLIYQWWPTRPTSVAAF
jgi:hypothetical protein